MIIYNLYIWYIVGQWFDILSFIGIIKSNQLKFSTQESLMRGLLLSNLVAVDGQERKLGHLHADLFHIKRT